MALEVTLLSKHIGAEVHGVDLSRPVSAERSDELHQLWLKRLVLLFRGQKLSQQDLLTATTIFGEVGKLARPKAFRRSIAASRRRWISSRRSLKPQRRCCARD